MFMPPVVGYGCFSGITHHMSPVVYNRLSSIRAKGVKCIIDNIKTLCTVIYGTWEEKFGDPA